MSSKCSIHVDSSSMTFQVLYKCKHNFRHYPSTLNQSLHYPVYQTPTPRTERSQIPQNQTELTETQLTKTGNETNPYHKTPKYSNSKLKSTSSTRDTFERLPMT
ncbi:hypothetical protein ACB098_01G314400 [Castanea mollissima]